MTNLALTIAALLPALVDVESRGNWDIHGDGGRSHGGLQIQQIAIDDANRILALAKDPRRFVLADAHDPVKAFAIANVILAYYGERYERRTGRPASAEVLARIWNGGPTGYRKMATFAYWNRVYIAMSRADTPLKINEKKC